MFTLDVSKIQNVFLVKKVTMHPIILTSSTYSYSTLASRHPFLPYFSFEHSKEVQGHSIFPMTFDVLTIFAVHSSSLGINVQTQVLCNYSRSCKFSWLVQLFVKLSLWHVPCQFIPFSGVPCMKHSEKILIAFVHVYNLQSVCDSSSYRSYAFSF